MFKIENFKTFDSTVMQLYWVDCINPTGKNEVTLEFHQHDDAQICLMEMRFYIPATSDNATEDPVKVCNLFFNITK